MDDYGSEGNGFEAFSVNSWDTAAMQGYYKFDHYSSVLPQYFLDGDAGDWNQWNHSNYIPLNAVVGINGIMYYHDVGYNENAIGAAVERTIYGEQSDDEAPYYSNQSPAHGATGIDPNANITVRVRDDGFGIDVDSIFFEVTYDEKVEVQGNLTGDNDADFLDMNLTFNPDDPLPANTEITVYVSAEDLVGNFGDDSNWTFTTGDEAGIETVSLGELKATFK